MSVSEPSEIFSVVGKSGSSMTLPLHSAGDHNGNAFPISSSSSSSSSSCLGELSPESLRSVSSLSGGRTDSPLDYDMLEVTLTTTVMTKTDKITEVVISKWSPEEESKQDDNDDVSVGMMQTANDLSESNDYSTATSVYLDANSSEYHQDTWNDNDNLTLALSLTTHGGGHGNNDELSSRSSNGKRHGSSTPDSDATEIPEDDDEEEALFLSVCSDVDVRRRTSVTLTSSTSESSGGLLNPSDSTPPTDFQTEGFVAVSVADEKSSEQVLEGADGACPLDSPGEGQTEPSASEDLSEPTQISSSTPSSTNPVQDAKEVTVFPPEEAERYEVNSKPTQSNTSQPARVAKTKPATVTSTAPKTAASTAVKTSSLEAKRVSKVDLKNVKAKVGSRSTPSPPKPQGQNKSAPANGKKAVPRKEEVQANDGGKRQRSSPMKVAVLRPIRGRNCNLKTSHKTAANDSARLEKKTAAITRMRSTSISSLGSEVAEEGHQDTPRKVVQEVSDTVETKHPSGAAGEEPVEDQKDGTGEALLTEPAVEKPRNHSRKVSSKLGPNARQLARGTRVDRGPSEPPAPPPGTGTGPPGQGSAGPRQAQTDVSKLGEGGQSAGGGSPMRARLSFSQSQGIPKPRTAAERASALASLGPAASNAKSAANQQPPSGSVGRPAAPAASKLPVKGLPTSLSSSSLGSNENNGATSKAPLPSPGAPVPTGTKPDERPSRSTLPVVSQSAAKLTSSSSTAGPCTSAPSAPSDTVSANTAAPKPPAMRSRALSLQARTTTTGLKAPSVTSHITAKTAAANQTAAKTPSTANQGPTKQAASQYPLQRCGSARLSRLNSSVDKNKPREAPARSTNNNSSSQLPAPAGGNNQNQQQPPPDLVSDVVNANASVTSVLPAPAAETTNNAATGAPGLGFKARTGSRSSPKTASRLQNAPKPGTAGTAVSDGTLAAKQNQGKEQVEKKNQAINQLRKLLIQGNKRVEALATVIQHLFTEREETLKQKKELSLELSNLRDELVGSSQCCERLQKEKEEVRVSLEEALKRLQEQHKEELVQLEDRLRSFYQTEWDKVHQTYQEEADKCRMLMEQQVEELRSRQEAERKNQEESHNQKIESLKQQYDTSIQELKIIQRTDLENLEKTLKETEASLSEKISELSAQKEDLNEKLKSEEERRRRILSDKNLKDSHTVYLEQELESLKVVLEIKNNQLHQKEKKIMEMDKLAETNVKLEECLKKVQQENEDYKARMDKHAALSKQLSSEQVKLQQTLQKESKVNKRLSMENEELLWKLHNGDLLASPRRLSPTSPFGSPRNSASFPTAPPLSPR
ncbi:microtubule-associated tumor suppressor 1 homolog isoform X3 [Scomber scombrus]|uniref:Microtubule-associated tumor suppressor 1 homolog isoform X3 n=1 Tax=Scomber scombrus TaxID=13677 RepID=A0AAV1PVZ7_SCOSC